MAYLRSITWFLTALAFVDQWRPLAAREWVTIHEGPGGAIHSLAFSPDGKTLVAGNQDGTVRVWDVTTGKKRATLHAHREAVVGVAVTADGKAGAGNNSTSQAG